MVNSTVKAKASEDVVAPVLAGAALLFALMLISVADALQDEPPWAWLVLLAAPLLPLCAGAFAWLKGHRELGSWLAGSFLTAVLAAGLRLSMDLSWLHNWQVWGVVAVLSLGVAALLRASVPLCVAGLSALGWVWLAYSANPPVDFLWSFLAVAALGFSIAQRDDSELGAVIFAATLIIWTGLTMQAGVVLGALGLVQAGLLSGMLLLATSLMLHAGRSPGLRVLPGGKAPDHASPAILLLLLAAAAAGAFAMSPFATTSQIADISQSAFWMWAGACITLAVTSQIALVFGQFALPEQAAMLLALILLTFAILILPGLALPPWWKAGGAGLLSFGAIWFSVRAFAGGDRRAGITGLAIWGGTVLLTTSGLASQGQRIAMFALFSLVAAGLYLGAERSLSK